VGFDRDVVLVAVLNARCEDKPRPELHPRRGCRTGMLF
jgi:hypothetical protein